MSILVALVIGLAVRALGPVGRRSLILALATSLVLLAGGVATGLSVAGSTNVPILALSVAAGMLIGRGVGVSGWAMLAVLAIVALVDLVQVVLLGSNASGAAELAAPAPSSWHYGMFVLDTPWSHTEIGALDLLLVAAVVEHGRRRGLAPMASIAPGPVGFLYANIASAAFHPSNMALVPFLLLGWITVEIVNRIVGGSRRPRAAAPDR